MIQRIQNIEIHLKVERIWQRQFIKLEHILIAVMYLVATQNNILQKKMLGQFSDV